MKKIIILLAAALLFAACDNGKVSYKGFSFSYPKDAYDLSTETIQAGGMQYLLLSKDNPNDIVYIEIEDNFYEDNDLKESDIAAASEALAEILYDIANIFYIDDEEVELDDSFEPHIKLAAEDAFSPSADLELRGTIAGEPFRSFITSTTYGDLAVTTILTAETDEVMKFHIDNVFKTFEWRAE